MIIFIFKNKSELPKNILSYHAIWKKRTFVKKGLIQKSHSVNIALADFGSLTKKYLSKKCFVRKRYRQNRHSTKELEGSPTCAFST